MPRLRLCSIALLLAATLGGCAGEEPLDRIDAEFGEEHERVQTHLGRVHVTLHTRGNLLSEQGEHGRLDVTARFVESHGLDEAFVRSRADLWPQPEQLVSPGHCLASDQLSGFVPLDAADTASTNYELVLLDAGTVQLHVGVHNVDVPMVLAPDLVPSMHGVEYVYTNESADWLADAEVLELEVEGSGDETLPGFRHRIQLPEPLGFTARPAPLVTDTIELRWQAGGGNPVVRVLGDEADVTCVLQDTGQFRLDLQGIGLDAAPSLDISASRTHLGRFDAGEFAGGEVIVEVREQARVERW